MDDAAWLSRQIRDLTEMMEGAYPKPWAVDDAPAPYIDAQMRGIIGIEVAITAMMGKWKVSQNRNEADREGVIEGLRAQSDAEAAAMADLVKDQLHKKRGGAHS
jgi:transcriptional regulator